MFENQEYLDELEKKLDKPTRKEKILFVVRFFVICITTFLILSFYQYPEINYWIKYVSTISLIVLCCTISHMEGVQNGMRIAKKHEIISLVCIEHMLDMIFRSDNQKDETKFDNECEYRDLCKETLGDYKSFSCPGYESCSRYHAFFEGECNSSEWECVDLER